MALDKDILGTALYNRMNDFDNKTVQELIDTYGSFEEARLASCKAMADEIINHFKNNAVLATTGKGLTAGGNAVIGTSTTTIIQ